MQQTQIAFGLVALPSDLARRLDRVCKRLGLEPGNVVGLAVVHSVAGLEALAKTRGAKWCRWFRSKGMQKAEVVTSRDRSKGRGK